MISSIEQLPQTSSEATTEFDADKVYYLLRMLINTDKYGAISKNRESKMLSLASRIEMAKGTPDPNEDARTKLWSILAAEIRGWFKPKKKLQPSLFYPEPEQPKESDKAKKKRACAEEFLKDLEGELKTSVDFDVFVVTCKVIMPLINAAIEEVPSDDYEFASVFARRHLDELKEKGLISFLPSWDKHGQDGCLKREQEIRNNLANKIANSIKNLKITDSQQLSIIASSIAEFERRSCQKRKPRAGNSLQDATKYILDYFGISETHPPEHFKADIEIDRWIPVGKSKIGISCKRTKRERWKQLSAANWDVMNTYKLLRIFHISTFDDDLSEDTIAALGSQRHLFYLSDDSTLYKKISNHEGLKNYVRPITSLIKDIKEAKLKYEGAEYAKTE